MQTNPVKYYEPRIPFGWKLVSAASYLSGFFGLNLILPFAVWHTFRNRFLRIHALNAGLIQLVELFFCALLYLLHYIFVIEDEQYMVSILQFFGEVFSKTPDLYLYLLILQSLVFLIVGTKKGALKRNTSWTNLRLYGFVSIIFVPVIFYNNLFWPLPGVREFRLVDPDHFQNPLALLPGHLFLLLSARLALTAIFGKLHMSKMSCRLYHMLLKEERKRGEKRKRAAKIRSLLIPGWGELYSNKNAAALFTFSLFFSLLMLTFFSFLLNYGQLVQNIPGLNANAAWYFLSELGLRAGTSDEHLNSIFGNITALAILTSFLLILYYYSRKTIHHIYKNESENKSPGAFSLSILLHIFPVIFILFIPLSFALHTRPQDIVMPFEPIEIIPEINHSQDKIKELNGPTTDNLTNKENENIVSFPKDNEGEAPDTAQKQKENIFEKSAIPSDRKVLTYSNYLSAKIRGAEKIVTYWSRLPTTYAVVVEYKITSDGTIQGIKIKEPSGYGNEDELTLLLIRSMGVLRTPPEKKGVTVTELFWNTHPADDSLESAQKRALSHSFDGRIISPLP